MAVGIERRRLRQDIERVGGDVLELEGDDVAGPGEGPERVEIVIPGLRPRGGDIGGGAAPGS
jgi:hypothetical protein